MSKIPPIVARAGALGEVAKLDIVNKGREILLVTGAKSFCESEHYNIFLEELQDEGKRIHRMVVKEEPSPELIDREIAHLASQGVDLVIAVGGGSVIDAGKAISAMLLVGGSVMDYLEGVGAGKTHSGKKVPFIALPTTSGTGSEATKNAVLSRVGRDGFKKSIRHEAFIPDYVFLDPALMVDCPEHITASSGMDALTQLIGAYVSTEANTMTDALCLSGIERFGKSFIEVCKEESHSLERRLDVAYGAYLSGIALANTGLGIVHGFASSVGGRIRIPHGVLCGTLLAEAIRMNITLLRDREDRYYLEKYAIVARLLTMEYDDTIDEACDRLIQVLAYWIDILRLPPLSNYGLREEELDGLVAITSYKNNPVPLNHHQMKAILRARL